MLTLIPYSGYTWGAGGERSLATKFRQKGLALYLSLKDVNKNYMLIAAASWSIAVAIYLVSRGQILSLLPLGGAYVAATSEPMKAAYLVSASQVTEVASIYGNMALILHQAGSIVMGLVMLQGVYGRRTGYLVTIEGTIVVQKWGIGVGRAWRYLGLAQGQACRGECDEGNGLS